MYYLREIVLWQSSSIERPFYWVVATILKLSFKSSMAILSSLLNHLQVLVDLCQIIQSMCIGFFKSGKKTSLFRLLLLLPPAIPRLLPLFLIYEGVYCYATHLLDLSWSVSFSSSAMKCSLGSRGGFPSCKEYMIHSVNHASLTL